MMVLRMMVKHQLTDILTYRRTDVLKIITQTTTTRTRLTTMNLLTYNNSRSSSRKNCWERLEGLKATLNGQTIARTKYNNLQFMDTILSCILPLSLRHHPVNFSLFCYICLLSYMCFLVCIFFWFSFWYFFFLSWGNLLTETLKRCCLFF